MRPAPRFLSEPSSADFEQADGRATTFFPRHLEQIRCAAVGISNPHHLSTTRHLLAPPHRHHKPSCHVLHLLVFIPLQALYAQRVRQHLRGLRPGQQHRGAVPREESRRRRAGRVVLSALQVWKRAGLLVQSEDGRQNVQIEGCVRSEREYARVPKVPTSCHLGGGSAL